MFKAFENIFCEHANVLFIGEDPYPNDNAMGLSFVWGDKITPSGRNIKKKLEEHIGYEIYDEACKSLLIHLSKISFLMINSTLTVYKANITCYVLS